MLYMTHTHKQKRFDFKANNGDSFCTWFGTRIWASDEIIICIANVEVIVHIPKGMVALIDDISGIIVMHAPSDLFSPDTWCRSNMPNQVHVMSKDTYGDIYLTNNPRNVDLKIFQCEDELSDKNKCAIDPY